MIFWGFVTLPESGGAVRMFTVFQGFCSCWIDICKGELLVVGGVEMVCEVFLYSIGE